MRRVKCLTGNIRVWVTQTHRTVGIYENRSQNGIQLIYDILRYVGVLTGTIQLIPILLRSESWCLTLSQLV